MVTIAGCHILQCSCHTCYTCVLFVLRTSNTWRSIEAVSGIVVFADKGQCYEVLSKLIDVYNNTRAAFHTRQQLMGGFWAHTHILYRKSICYLWSSQLDSVLLPLFEASSLLTVSKDHLLCISAYSEGNSVIKFII